MKKIIILTALFILNMVPAFAQLRMGLRGVTFNGILVHRWNSNNGSTTNYHSTNSGTDFPSSTQHTQPNTPPNFGPSMPVIATNGKLEIGDRYYNKGYLLWGGKIMTLTRDQLAQRVHLYLGQPNDSRLMILQNTQSGTVSIFTRLNNGSWKIVADNKTGLLPTLIKSAENQYKIYWGDVYDRTVTFNY